MRTQRQHTTATVLRARQLAGAGWRPAEIQRLLARDGVEVSLATVGYWLDEAMAQRRRDQQRHAMARHRRLKRLRDLDGAGVPPKAITAVLRLDYGDDLTVSQVRYALQTGKYPTKRKAAA